MNADFIRGEVGKWAIIALTFANCVQGATKAELLDCRRIWDHAPHNAFTDLARLRGKWICCFREGSAHVSADGAVRIIESSDGKNWNSAALING